MSDPPPPVIQLQVRTPSHVPVGKPVSYKITVVNGSQAKALNVTVRMPAPVGVALLTKCEPLADGINGPFPAQGLPPGEIKWTIPKLNRGETKSFEVEFQPAKDGKQVSARAYVAFEYGAKVETAIAQPKITVKKSASPQVTVGEPITVQVDVTNTSPVAVSNVALTEAAPADVEIRGDSDAEKTNNPGQRVWKLESIAPGQTKTVTYQMLARTGGEVLTKSFVSNDAGVIDAASAESKTRVVVPALSLDLAGPAKAEPRSPATYTATVRNVGTMPLSNVRVEVDVPDDLNVVRVTNGCRTDRNPRVWIIPRLLAGESHQVRVVAEPNPGVSGRRAVKASVRETTGRLEDQVKEVATDFVGQADISWRPTFEKVRLRVGSQGRVRVEVKNDGSETDKGVSLRVIAPPEVRITDTGPVRADLVDGNTVVFPPQAVAPGRKVEFSVTFEGKTAGQGMFRLMLESESLEKAVTKDQTVEVE